LKQDLFCCLDIQTVAQAPWSWPWSSSWSWLC
jgi:hypothetical protein